MAVIFAAYDKVAEEMKTAPLSAELMERARLPLLEQYRKAQRENAAWLGIVDAAQSRPQDLDRWRRRIALLEEVTTADLQRQARVYFVGTPLRIEVVSSKAPAK